MHNTTSYADAVFTATITAQQQETLATMNNPHLSLQCTNAGHTTGQTIDIEVIDIIDDATARQYTIEYDGTLHVAEVYSNGD